MPVTESTTRFTQRPSCPGITELFLKDRFHTAYARLGAIFVPMHHTEFLYDTINQLGQAIADNNYRTARVTVTRLHHIAPTFLDDPDLIDLKFLIHPHSLESRGEF